MLLLYLLYNNYFNKIISLLKNSSLNITLIYNVKNNNINKTSKKIYDLKFYSNLDNILIPEVSKIVVTFLKIKRFNKAFINKLIYKIKESGYFNKIEYNYLYINTSKYIIFRIKTNTILKRIKISKYKQLKISKNFLIKLFKSQIGLPINYKLIDLSINQINKWYRMNGFEWHKINYNYCHKTNEININILEGKILNSYCIYDEIITNIADKTKINKLNSLIKQELNIISGTILNIHDLERKIVKLKEKYFINYIKYKVEYNSNNIDITVKYNFSNFNKLSMLNKDIILQDYFRIISFFIFNKKINRIKKLIDNIYKNLIYQYNIKYYNFYNIKYKNIILNIFIKIQLNNQLQLFSHALLYNKIYLYTNIGVNNILKIIIHDIYIYKYCYKNIIYNYTYHYLKKILSIKIKLSIKYLNKIEIIQSLDTKYSKYISKHFIHYLYNDFHKFIDIYKLNFLNKVKKDTFFIYKIKIKHNYLYLLTKNNLIIYYKMCVNLNIETMQYLKSSKYYLHNIQLNYKKLYKIPTLIKYENILYTIINLNILIGNLSKCQNILQNFSKQIILKIEYQLYINKRNFIYLYYHNKSNHKTLYSIINDNSYSVPIYVGIGIQTYMPIEYIPNIRLEMVINSCKKQLFYFYIKPLLII